MALTISQIIAVSYPSVVNEMRKPANQWTENAMFREMERQKMINKIAGGPTIEKTLDYRANPNATFLTTDLQPIGATKTDVLTAAVYDPAQLSVPIVWSKGDEAKNPEENQKVAFVKSLLENAINSHDDLIEQAIFSTSTSGFLGLQNIVPTSGQGSPGGVDAATEVWWRNYASTYNGSSFTDLVAKMTIAWNTAAKGSGSQTAPTLIVADAATQAGFEGTQQAFQRYVDTEELKAGFKVIAFKTSRFIYSQYGSTKIYFLNPKSFSVDVFKNAFRLMGDTIELPNAEGYIRKIFTVTQAGTNNKSRLAVLSPA